MTARIRAGCKRFKDVAGVLCKKGLSVKLRGFVDKMYIKSYRVESWPIKGNNIERMEFTKIRMLLNDMGKTLKNEVESEPTLKKLVLKTLKKFLKSPRFRWFQLIERMSNEKALAMAMKITVKDKKEKLRNNGWRLLRKT